MDRGRDEDKFRVLANDFFFLDGTTKIFVNDSVFLWAATEPDNSQTNQRCTNIDRGNGDSFTVNNWIDQDSAGKAARSLGGVICKRPCQLIEGNFTECDIQDVDGGNVFTALAMISLGLFLFRLGFLWQPN